MFSFLKNIFGNNQNSSDPIYEEVKTALAEYDALLSSGYLNHTKVAEWKAHCSALIDKVNETKYKTDALGKREALVESLISKYIHIDMARHLHNDGFMEEELTQWAHLFDNVAGAASLNSQQRKAVVTDEDNNLVIASAGSGKTTTIVAKTRYLITRFGIDPKEILLLVLTHKAKQEMEKYIKQTMNIDMEVMTFPSLSRHIIAQAQSAVPNFATPKALAAVVESILGNLKKDPEYVGLLRNYFAFYLPEYRAEAEFDTLGDYILYFKNNYFPIQPILSANTSNWQKTLFKNMEEIEIANFLFIHHIDYEYRPRYQHACVDLEQKTYHPDFYLPKYGIYIEHFSLDEEDNCPNWFKTIYNNGKTYTYQDNVVWKRNLHTKYGTKLIEMFSYEKQNGVFIKNLAQRLVQHGINLDRPRPTLKVWEAIEQQYPFAVVRFDDLFYTFLTMLKCNNLNLEKINARNERLEGYERLRNELFLQLFNPIYEQYEQYLEDSGEIDFNTVINHATAHINIGNYRNEYKYIIIDELEDISGVRIDLIKALKKSNPHCKLFCLGDDWQTIYRFAGSDASLFANFENIFGITERLSLHTVYRFDESLINVSNYFISKNPFQANKKVYAETSKPPLEAAYQIVYTQPKISDTIARLLAQIVEKNGGIGSNTLRHISVLIIGRTEDDNEEWKQICQDKTQFTLLPRNEKQIPLVYKAAKEMKIIFSAAHSVKGLQADYVILLNCSDGKFDFPSQTPDDNVMQLLMHQASYYPYAEERRLFYMAMTRARRKVYFLANENYPSIFIRELAKYNAFSHTTDPRICPNCQTGRIIQRQIEGTFFYGCTLHPYCEQTMTGESYQKILAKKR